MREPNLLSKNETASCLYGELAVRRDSSSTSGTAKVPVTLPEMKGYRRAKKKHVGINDYTGRQGEG